MKIRSKSAIQQKRIQTILKNRKASPLFGNNRSFACNQTKRMWKLNKQKVYLNNKSMFVPRSVIKMFKKESIK